MFIRKIKNKFLILIKKYFIQIYETMKRDNIDIIETLEVDHNILI